MAQRPRSLDLYAPEFHRILERVRDEGKFFHVFDSQKEANTIKTDFNRYRNSVLAYLPDSWEADLVRNIMLRKNGASLEWVKRSSWGAIAGLKQALAAPINDGTTDEEAEALRKLDEDIKHGRY